MRRLRVCIYGGTHLNPSAADLVSSIAYKILDQLTAILVTGGFVHSGKDSNAVSTDFAALRGARRYADEHGKDLRDCFEAWVPEPELDKRSGVKPFRMGEDDGITVRVLTGRTPLGRRLSMVAGVDMLITISGKQHTEVVVEQGLELGVPVLPIPNFAGDTATLLKKYRERIAAAFDPGAIDQCLRSITNAVAANPESAARAVIELMRTAKVGKCLILLPYDDEHNALYTSVIEPAVIKHMIAMRLDRLPRSEAIYSSFADAIRSCSGVIADITVLNENVMYEIGYAHGGGQTPLIYSRDPARLDNLPVYFRTLNVRLATSQTPLHRLINEYLLSSKAAGRAHQSTVA